MAEAPRISANELKRRMHAGEQFFVIDTRNPVAWAESDSKAAGAVRIPLDELDNRIDEIPRNKPIVAYCT